MQNIKIETCTIKDITLLQELSINTYVQTFEKFNSKSIMNAYLNDAFNLEKLEKELLNSNSAFYFLYKDERLVGYLKVNDFPSQTDINDESSLEIERFYILSDFQGQGLGKFLMKKAIDIANEKNKKYVWLGVWEHNEKAKRFYKKEGFYKIGEHSFFMGDDEQTDYLMRKDLE
ncbi:MAG: GNAT family N-acetyltransferase [Clostridiales bacterium]|nr:GNAT family N-acetyltransferase [Clostridiales bacterium]